MITNGVYVMFAPMQRSKFTGEAYLDKEVNHHARPTRQPYNDEIKDE